jgi:transketolase
MDNEHLSELKARAYNLRVLSLQATTQAGSGHPTSCLSAADIVAALFFSVMHYNAENPQDPTNDRFILSKGHAAPVLYAVWEQKGVLTFDELMQLRTFGSELEGHPTARFAYNDASTGSLGCGLSIGLGMALSGRLQEIPFYTYVLLGDSEMSEGSVWEAIEISAFYKVSRLIAIVDLNRLGQSTETLDDHQVAQHAARWKAFGWNTLEIDGHNMEAILKAFEAAKAYTEGPTVIIARTIKGYGLSGIEDKPGYHGKTFSREQLPELLQSLKKRFPEEAHVHFERKPIARAERKNPEIPSSQAPPVSYQKGILKATRKAYGESLALLGEYVPEILSLDAEVKNSTFAELFENKFPHRFFQCFIAEQNMIGMAIGFAQRGYIPFSSTFACFLTRAHDQIRMASIGKVPLRLVGSHCGVSIGQDGPSQMALEDIAMIRAIPDSVILYPSDAVSTYALIQLMVTYVSGISYLRCTRSDTQVIYGPSETFVLGGSKILRESGEDVACIVAAGITVFEALKAYEALKEKNIMVSVIDLYSVKPLDQDTLTRQAGRSHKRIITVEDHYIQGGVGEAVCAALANQDIHIEMLAVRELSRSGSPAELLAYHKIDSVSIIEAVYKLLVT